jgi:hypothetical protein
LFEPEPTQLRLDKPHLKGCTPTQFSSNFRTSPAAVVSAQTSDPWCVVSGRGTLTNGDSFVGHASINLDRTVAPGAIWRHTVAIPAGTPAEVLLGIVEAGLCLRDGQTILALEGIGRFTGLPVEFELVAIDGSPDGYAITVRDSTGAVVYELLSEDVVSGDRAIPESW